MFLIFHVFSVFIHVIENYLLDWKCSDFFGSVAFITAGGLWSTEQDEEHSLISPELRLCFLIIYTFSLQAGRIPHAS